MWVENLALTAQRLSCSHPVRVDVKTGNNLSIYSLLSR